MIKLDDDFKDWYFDNIPVWYLNYAYQIYLSWKNYDKIKTETQKLIADFDKQFEKKVISLQQVKNILDKLPKEK